MREVIITTILQGFDQKKQFSEGCSWFKYGKRVKTKSQEIFGANSYACRICREKTGREPFCPSS